VPFVTPDVVYVQDPSGAWWTMRAENFQKVARVAITGGDIGGGLKNWARRLRRTPRGVKGSDKLVWTQGGMGFVRGLQTQGDWRQALKVMDLRPERFSFFSFVFDISRAKRIARRNKLRVLRAVPDEDWWGGLRASIRVNQTHVDSRLNLGKPAIFGTLMDGPLTLLLDGNHRSTRAMKEGKEMPYVILSLPQTLETIQTKGESLRSLRNRVITVVHEKQEREKGA